MTVVRLIVHCLLVHLVKLAFVNVAINKPSWQSSTDFKWNATRANDGNKSNGISMDGNSCSHTAGSGENESWWMVNLMESYDITHVLLTARDWEKGPGRLAGFSIYISKDKDWNEDDLCFYDANPQCEIANERRIDCTSVKTGQYLVVFNERPVFNAAQGFTYSNFSILELCEVEVPIDVGKCTDIECTSCEIGWYGKRCENTCGQCGGIGGCNKETGICDSGSCLSGSHGQKCAESCPTSCRPGSMSCDFNTLNCRVCNDSYYGSLCQSRCPRNCYRNRCDKDTGHCKKCKNSFYGQSCSISCQGCGGDGSCNISTGNCDECRQGRYGGSCNHNCPVNCQTCVDDKNCHSCKKGYYGPTCERSCQGCGGNGLCYQSDGVCHSSSCMPRYYSGYYFRGKCNKRCSSNCKNDGSCSPYYGYCTYGCKDGYFGGNCNRSCPSNCGGNMFCTRYNGTCKGGCNLNFMGQFCNETCPQNCGGDNSCSKSSGKCKHNCNTGWFGQQCNKRCPTNCAGERCDRSNGECSKDCKKGLYGRYCNISCPLNCGSEKLCSRSSGECFNGCIEGWFGQQCNKTCPKNCAAKVCDRLSGECLNECDNGWFGPHCNKTCPGDCRDRSCNKFDGACMGECSKTYYGQKCSLDCPVNCDGDRSCHKETGICKEGCTPGWNGSHCESECEFPKFGNYCMEDCGNCRNQSCHHINGTCMLGCEDGWLSQHCDIESNVAGVMGFIVMVGSGGAVFILAVSTVLVLVLLRKRGNSKETTSDVSKTVGGGLNAGSDKVMHNATYASILPVGENFGAFSPIIDGAMPDITQFETIEDLERTYYNTDEIPKGIKMSELKGYFIEKRRTKKLEAEFRALPNGSIHPTTFAELPKNMKKNRFKNTLPYDHSRVRLQGKMDFINANFIEDASGIKKYIATQGPIQKTIEDFWQMIWENNIDKIVMLTNLLEGGKKKCEQYWPNPNEKMTGGQYGLTLKDERIFSYYTLRELQIVDNKSKEKRDILQYHFTTWPDHGTPDPLLLILFHKRVTSTAPKYDGPILVHCSAGIGRTGTFIALDALESQGANTGVVDIENYVRIMRKDRMNMIQTSEQYKVLHEALIEAFQWKDTSIAMDEFPSIWRSMDSYKSPLNQQLLKKEYDMLREMNIVSEDEMSLTALKEENKIKNRSVNILPLDKHRPYLTSYCSGQNDYINAVIIPSHISKEAFMVTQVPLPGTIVDFWRLITDNDSRCIIYFASSSDEETDFFPARVNSTETESHLIQKESMTFLQQSVEETKMTVQNKKSNETTEVLMLKIDMADRSFPSATQIFRAAEVVELQRRRYKQSPCTVIAFYGCTPCEVFCAFSNILEYMKVDNRIDVFQTARQLQIRRPEFFSKFETYRYCYQIINEYLLTQSVYCNN